MPRSPHVARGVLEHMWMVAQEGDLYILGRHDGFLFADNVGVGDSDDSEAVFRVFTQLDMVREYRDWVNATSGQNMKLCKMKLPVLFDLIAKKMKGKSLNNHKIRVDLSLWIPDRGPFSIDTIWSQTARYS